ncbi:hypothetical protein [Microbacterium laevaniformans]|uniref:hypothetical protein n=1 Tax=Microbacterium laevaniformans TaxID=36807 RepID=UPI00362B1D11
MKYMINKGYDSERTIDNVTDLREKGEYFYFVDSSATLLYVVRSRDVYTIELIPAGE